MKKNPGLIIKWEKYVKPITVEIEFVNLDFENEPKWYMKNAGTTYQCVATTLLHEMIHKEV